MGFYGLDNFSILDLASQDKKNQKERILLAPLLLAVSLPAFVEEKPKIFKECIKNASRNNSK